MIRPLKRLNVKPVFFDVSLRDGLQTFKEIMPLNEKINILNNILNKYNPNSIEIGSVVSPKILPQMENSLELLKYAKTLNKENNYFMLVPNMKYLKIAINSGVDNFSLITSVSDSFQKKNTNKNLTDTKKEIDNMIKEIKLNNIDSKIKLYISCINECPLDGKQKNKEVIREIETYFDYEVDEICLSDTCGTLMSNDCKDIIDNLYGRDYSKLSLHLHYSDINNLSDIFKYCYSKGIIKYDVSILKDSGGCSVTMKDTQINGNLHYDLFNLMINELNKSNKDNYFNK